MTTASISFLLPTRDAGGGGGFPLPAITNVNSSAFIGHVHGGGRAPVSGVLFANGTAVFSCFSPEGGGNKNKPGAKYEGTAAPCE